VISTKHFVADLVVGIRPLTIISPSSELTGCSALVKLATSSHFAATAEGVNESSVLQTAPCPFSIVTSEARRRHTFRPFVPHLRDEAGAQLKDSAVDVGALGVSVTRRVCRGLILTFWAVRTPTSGAMNSGFNPLSMSGGRMVSVIADAAIWAAV
jgi:hypothetical protein